MDRPERDTQVGHLRAGDRFCWFGEWHDLARVQHMPYGVYLTTDAEPPRTFVADPAFFVAAETLPRASS